MEAVWLSVMGPCMLLFPTLLSLGDGINVRRWMPQTLSPECVCLIQSANTYDFKSQTQANRSFTKHHRNQLWWLKVHQKHKVTFQFYAAYRWWSSVKCPEKMLCFFSTVPFSFGEKHFLKINWCLNEMGFICDHSGNKYTARNKIFQEKTQHKTSIDFFFSRCIEMKKSHS